MTTVVKKDIISIKGLVREKISTADDENGYVDDKGRGHESVEIDQRLQVYYSKNGDTCQLTACYYEEEPLPWVESTPLRNLGNLEVKN